jgi:hypothetical protein
MNLSRAVPSLTIAISVPQRPAAMSKGEHNRVSKDALREVLKTHHKERIPGHFAHGAHSKYGYQPRSQKYIARKIKLGLGGTDLVEAGGTKQEMTSHAEFVMSGAAEGAQKKLGGKIVLKFAFGKQIQMGYAKRGAYEKATGQTYDSPRGKSGGVDLAQMKKEISTIIPEERRLMAEQFRREYLKGYRAIQATALELEYARGAEIRASKGWVV